MSSRIKLSPKRKIALYCLIAVMAVVLVELTGFFQCYYYASRLRQNNFQIMRIKLYGSTETPEGVTVSANISVLDWNGGTVSVIERSWPESYIAVDLREARILNKSFFFPDLIYGTNSVNAKKASFFNTSGTDLERYYIENRKCLLGTNNFQKKALYRLSCYSLNKNTVNLSQCETGIYYGIFIENGKVELRPE